MFAFIDQQNNVVSVVTDAMPFTIKETDQSSNSAIYQCVEINDQKFLDSIIYIPSFDENLQPTSNTNAVVPSGWKYTNETFIFDNKVVNNLVEPVIDYSYPFTPTK